MTNTHFQCNDCGWIGSSEELTRQPILYIGGFETETYCPACGSFDLSQIDDEPALPESVPL